MKKIVGVAEMIVSSDPKDSIMAYSLGSCIGLAAYDPYIRAGGVLHFMLPESSLDKSKAKNQPLIFADTGIPLLFEQIYALGADKSKLNIYIAGGGEILNQSGFFNIGRQNYNSVKKILIEENMMITDQIVGGNINRSLRLEISTGNVYIKTPGSSEEKI